MPDQQPVCQSRVQLVQFGFIGPIITYTLSKPSLFQALGLWGKSEKAGERGKDERGRRRAKEREPVRISLTALCRYSRSCYTL